MNRVLRRFDWLSVRCGHGPTCERGYVPHCEVRHAYPGKMAFTNCVEYLSAAFAMPFTSWLIHPSRHCKIHLSITQLCAVKPLQLLNSDQCAPHSLRRKEPPSSGTKAPRQDSVMEPPWCRQPRRKGGKRWIARDIPSAKGRLRHSAELTTNRDDHVFQDFHKELPSSAAAMYSQP